MPLLADVQIPYVEQAAIAVDALAEEAAWAQAATVQGFTVFWPEPDAAPTGDTAVRLLADAEALYLFFEARDPEPDKLRAAIGRRDTRWNDDFVAFYLDTTGEAQRAYLFGVTAKGVQMDGTRVEGGEHPEDMAWDGIWQAEARPTAQGWQAELRIPWRILRHPAPCEKLGLFLFRHVARLGEKSSWPAVDQDIQGLLVQEAQIGGPGTLPPSRGLDLVPELAFGWTDQGPANHRFGWKGVFPGLTARWSPTPSTSILGAFNPDFSQVESDEAQVDVNRRYALYYKEKRPFFLEGREWFQHGFDELVYTRSMVLPLYGARATVEEGGWTAAVLHVLDAQPSASVSEGGGWTEADLAGHRASETVLRARRAVGPDGHVGLLLSDREVLGTDLGNRLVGVDTRVRLSDRWIASGSALSSQTRFSDGATSWVPAGNAELSYGDSRWEAGLWGWYLDPGFRAENGYLTASDQVGGGTWGGLTLHPDSKLLPGIMFQPLDAKALWTTEGALRDLKLKPEVWFQFGNGAGLWLQYQHAGTLWNDTWLTTRAPCLWIGEAWTDWLEAELYAQTGVQPYYDASAPRSVRVDAMEPAVTLRPWPWLAFGGSATWEQAHEDGETLYRGWVGRARLDAFASRAVWARLIADWSTFSGERGTEALLAWEQAPGRAVYLGGRLDLPEDGPLAWQVQGKVSWVFSI